MRIAVICLAVLIFLAGVGLAENVGGNMLPRCDFKDIWVITYRDMSPPEQLLAATLQGLTADNPDKRIWLRNPGIYEALLQGIKMDGVKIHEAKSVWEIVNEFKPDIKGVIVCKIGTDSLNVATSLCGPKGCVAVDESLLDLAKSNGFAVVEDVRGMDDRTALAKYKDLFKHGVVVSQANTIAGHLRDFAVARHAYTCGTEPAFVKEAAAEFGPEALVFGWGREREWVTGISSANATSVPADWALNLSIIETLPAGKLESPKDATLKTEDNVRYIAFVMSDGDNLQWFCGGFFDGLRYWGNPLRGEFPITWEIPVSAAEFAPRALRYAYTTASKNDSFVTGAGVPGYTYPHLQPDRVALAKSAAPYLRKADLPVVGVINDNAGTLQETFPILERPEVKGVLYKAYNPYDGMHGALIWHKGKPCISFKFDLRESRQPPEKIAEEVAKMPASPKTDEGSYALVTVLAWGYQNNGGPMEAVRRTIELLPKNTRVVSANQLVQLMLDNFSKKHLKD